MVGFTGCAEEIAKAAGVAEQTAATEGWLRRMAANGSVTAEFKDSVWIYTIK